jgi:hypothetical protein
MRFCNVYHAHLCLKVTPIRIQHVEEIFFALILRSFDIPVKSIIIMMLRSIFLKKLYQQKKTNQQQD